MWVVGGIFAAIGLVMMAAAARQLAIDPMPETVPVAFLAFGWASFSMAVSIAIGAMSSRSVLRSERTDTESGTVTLHQRSPDGIRPSFTLTGPGATAEGEAVIRVQTRAPALFLGAACVALFCTSIALVLHARVSLIGAGIALLICFYMANWAKNAWPRAGQDPA